MKKLIAFFVFAYVAVAFAAGPIMKEFTAGQIPYVGAGKVLTGSANFIWDYTNGRLGINATPTRTLDIVNGEGSVITAKITRTGHNSVYIVQSSNDSWFAADTSANTSVGVDASANEVEINANSTRRFAALSSGRITIPAVHNNGSGCGASTATGELCSGTYVPDIVGVANVVSATSEASNYFRIGNIVTAFGRFQLDPTAADVTTTLTIPLPVASNIAASSDVHGLCQTNAQGFAIKFGLCYIQGDSSGNAATLHTYPTDGHGTGFIWYSFTYEVLP